MSVGACRYIRPADGPHRTARLSNGVRTFEIDEHMAPMLILLWGLGCSTEYSCHGDQRRPAEIIFTDAMSLNVALRWFLRAAQQLGDEELVDRVCSRSMADSRRTANLYHWTIEAWPKLGFETGYPTANGDPLVYRIRMPYGDLDTLTATICEQMTPRPGGGVPGAQPS